MIKLITRWLDLYERFVVVQERVLEMSLQVSEYNRMITDRNIEAEKERQARREEEARIHRLQTEADIETRADIAESLKKLTGYPDD